MRKHIFILMMILSLTSCAELGQILESTASISDAQIASALKQALDFGISKKVTLLGNKDGFYKRNSVKIHFPQELNKVENTLRQLGLNSLVDQGEEMLNRAAEDAVKEAIPIFKNAIQQMSFNDARQILMGDKDAATQYLKRTTSTSLRSKFYPVIKNSFSRVGADDIWENIITRYNSIPFIHKVNPDLTDYLTDKAMEGVFKMVAQEELEIRNSIRSRTTDLLRKVFALQDQK